MTCVYVTLGPTGASAEEPSGAVCVYLSASGDKNHQAVACSAQPNNVSNGYVSPGVSPRTRRWEPTNAYTVSVDLTETSKSHNDAAINVPKIGPRRSTQGPVHLHFDDRGEPITNGDPTSNVAKAAAPAPSVRVYLDMLPKPTSTSPAAGAHTSTTTCVDRDAGLHSKISEFFGKCGSRRNRTGTLARHGKGQHSASLRRGHQAGRGYYDGYLRHGLDRWTHTGQWTKFKHDTGQWTNFKHDTTGPRQAGRRGRHRGKGGPHTSGASGGTGCHPMQFPECDPSMHPGGVHQNWGHHVSPACVAVAAPFEASQYRQQVASKVSDADDDDSARPRDTDTKMRLATFDGEVSSWTGWSFSCLAYFRRSKRETYLLGEVPVPLRQTEAQIRRALIGADLTLGLGDRKYVRTVRAGVATRANGGGASDAAAAIVQPANVGTSPEDFDLDDVVMPVHSPEITKLLDDDVASVLAREKRQHEAWLYTTTSIFDEIVMSTVGQAAKLVHAVTSRFGHDAWTALNDEYGKLMKGDRTLFTRRLTNGEVTHGQIGMQEGDSVKSFIRDLNSLHSALYWCVPHDERASVPELQYSNMKEVLQNSLSSEYLTVLTAHDGAQNGNATYKDLCLKVITHENLLATRGALRGTSSTGVVAAATDERTDDGTEQHGRGIKRQASGGFDSRDHGKRGGKGYHGHGGGKGGSSYSGRHGKGSGDRACYGCGSTQHIYRNCTAVSDGDKSAAHFRAQKGKFEQTQNSDVTDIKKALAMLITQSAPSPAMAAPSAAPAPGFMDGWMNVAACDTSAPLVFGTQTASVLNDSARVVRLSDDGNRGWVTVDFRASEPRCRAHYHAFRETSADHQGLASGHVCYQGTVAGQRTDCDGDAELARSLSELWEQPAYKQRVSKGCSGDGELARSLSITVEDCSADADIAASLQERPREDCSADTDLAASLQERPRDDCSCDEQLARVLAGVNIASPDSVDTSKLVQGKRTQTARKNYARNERRRQRKAKVELDSTWPAAVHAHEALVEEMEEYHVYLHKHWLQRQQLQPNKYVQRAIRVVARESLENFEVSHPVVPAADRKCDQHDYSAPFTGNHILRTDLLRAVPCMQGCDDRVPIVADTDLDATALALTVNNADRVCANVERTVSFDTLAVANKSQRSLYDTDVFIIDTGAGELVSPHEGDFVPGSFVEPYGQRVVAAGSEKHTVVKLGRLRVRCMTTGHTIDSGSQLAWYVPTMTFRLGGMGRLRSIGYGLSIGLGDADFLCHVLSGVKVPVLTYNQVSVLRVEQTGIDSTLATYLTGRFAEESALGKALATSGPNSLAMVVVGELVTASDSDSNSTRCLSEQDSTTRQESASDRHTRKHSSVQLEQQTGMHAPDNHGTSDEVTAAGADADTTCASNAGVLHDEDDECGGDDHVYHNEDEHNSYVESTMADIGDGMADARVPSDNRPGEEYDPLGAIAEAEAEYAAEGPAYDTETGPTATEFMAECPKYVELMKIASEDEKESLASFAHTIETTRGELSMRSEILASAVDIVLNKTLLEARTRIRKQLIDLSGESETAREMATDASTGLEGN